MEMRRLGDSPSGELLPKDAMVRAASLMKNCARATISLNKDGEVKEISMLPDFVARGNYIVVIGPSKKHDNQEVIRLEIGLNRSTPYMQFEWKEGRRKKAIKGRKHVPLSSGEILHLLPTISKTIQQIVDEKVARWESLSKKTISDGVVRLWWRGCFVTASKNDELLLYALLLLDRHARNSTFLRSFAIAIQRSLGGYKKVSYSKKELLVRKAVLIIKDKLHLNYSKEQIEILLRLLGKPGSKVRYLLEGIIMTLNVKPRTSLESYEEEFLKLQKKYKSFDQEIKKAFCIEVATHPKRDDARNHHAKECLRIEVLPSKEAREHHERKRRYQPGFFEDEECSIAF